MPGLQEKYRMEVNENQTCSSFTPLIRATPPEQRLYPKFRLITVPFHWTAETLDSRHMQQCPSIGRIPCALITRGVELFQKRMPLSAGTRLGPYEILSQIGAGGMGKVYGAADKAANLEG